MKTSIIVGAVFLSSFGLMLPILCNLNNDAAAFPKTAKTIEALDLIDVGHTKGPVAQSDEKVQGDVNTHIQQQSLDLAAIKVAEAKAKHAAAKKETERISAEIRKEGLLLVKNLQDRIDRDNQDLKETKQREVEWRKVSHFLRLLNIYADSVRHSNARMRFLLSDFKQKNMQSLLHDRVPTVMEFSPEAMAKWEASQHDCYRKAQQIIQDGRRDLALAHKRIRSATLFSEVDPIL